MFGVIAYVPELAVAAVLYVTLRRSFTVGATSTFIFAAVADLCWGGPRGYYAFGLTLVFFLLSALRLRRKPRHPLALSALVFPATVAVDTISLTAMAIFRRGHTPLDAIVTIVPIAALVTAITALPLFWVANQLDRLSERRKITGASIGGGSR